MIKKKEFGSVDYNKVDDSTLEEINISKYEYIIENPNHPRIIDNLYFEHYKFAHFKYINPELYQKICWKYDNQLFYVHKDTKEMVDLDPDDIQYNKFLKSKGKL